MSRGQKIFSPCFLFPSLCYDQRFFCFVLPVFLAHIFALHFFSIKSTCPNLVSYARFLKHSLLLIFWKHSFPYVHLASKRKTFAPTHVSFVMCSCQNFLQNNLDNMYSLITNVPITDSGIVFHLFELETFSLQNTLSNNVPVFTVSFCPWRSMASGRHEQIEFRMKGFVYLLGTWGTVEKP